MFGWKLIHKREMALYSAQIAQFRNDIEELKKSQDHERRRAEGAINLLLMRTQKAAITPDIPMTEEQEEAAKAKMFNIFGDEYEENDLIERVQDVHK